MSLYKFRDYINVMRWDEDLDEWKLMSTRYAQGTRDEEQFFRVIVPGGGKLFFDGPDAYLNYTNLEEDSLPMFEEHARRWREKMLLLNKESVVE